MTTAAQAFRHDRFLIEGLARFRVSAARPDGAGQETIAFATRKRRGLRYYVRVFAPGADRDELFTIVPLARGVYDVIEPGGLTIGALVPPRGPLDDTWRILDSRERELAQAKEPKWTALAGILAPRPFLIIRSYAISMGSQRVGTIRMGLIPNPFGAAGSLRVRWVRPSVLIDFTADRLGRLERRLAVALGIAIRTL